MEPVLPKECVERHLDSLQSGVNVLQLISSPFTDATGRFLPPIDFEAEAKAGANVVREDRSSRRKNLSFRQGAATIENLHQVLAHPPDMLVLSGYCFSSTSRWLFEDEFGGALSLDGSGFTRSKRRRLAKIIVVGSVGGNEVMAELLKFADHVISINEDCLRLEGTVGLFLRSFIGHLRSGVPIELSRELALSAFRLQPSDSLDQMVRLSSNDRTNVMDFNESCQASISQSRRELKFPCASADCVFRSTNIPGQVYRSLVENPRCLAVIHAKKGHGATTVALQVADRLASRRVFDCIYFVPLTRYFLRKTIPVDSSFGDCKMSDLLGEWEGVESMNAFLGKIKEKSGNARVLLILDGISSARSTCEEDVVSPVVRFIAELLEMNPTISVIVTTHSQLTIRVNDVHQECFELQSMSPEEMTTMLLHNAVRPICMNDMGEQTVSLLKGSPLAARLLCQYLGESKWKGSIDQKGCAEAAVRAAENCSVIATPCDSDLSSWKFDYIFYSKEDGVCPLAVPSDVQFLCFPAAKPATQTESESITSPPVGTIYLEETLMIPPVIALLQSLQQQLKGEWWKTRLQSCRDQLISHCRRLVEWLRLLNGGFTSQIVAGFISFVGILCEMQQFCEKYTKDERLKLQLSTTEVQFEWAVRLKIWIQRIVEFPFQRDVDAKWCDLFRTNVENDFQLAESLRGCESIIPKSLLDSLRRIDEITATALEITEYLGLQQAHCEAILSAATNEKSFPLTAEIELTLQQLQTRKCELTQGPVGSAVFKVLQTYSWTRESFEILASIPLRSSLFLQWSQETLSVFSSEEKKRPESVEWSVSDLVALTYYLQEACSSMDYWEDLIQMLSQTRKSSWQSDFNEGMLALRSAIRGKPSWGKVYRGLSVDSEFPEPFDSPGTAKLFTLLFQIFPWQQLQQMFSFKHINLHDEETVRILRGMVESPMPLHQATAWFGEFIAMSKFDECTALSLFLQESLLSAFVRRENRESFVKLVKGSPDSFRFPPNFTPYCSEYLDVTSIDACLGFLTTVVTKAKDRDAKQFEKNFEVCMAKAFETNGDNWLVFQSVFSFVDREAQTASPQSKTAGMAEKLAALSVSKDRESSDSLSKALMAFPFSSHLTTIKPSERKKCLESWLSVLNNYSGECPISEPSHHILSVAAEVLFAGCSPTENMSLPPPSTKRSSFFLSLCFDNCLSQWNTESRFSSLRQILDFLQDFTGPDTCQKSLFWSCLEFESQNRAVSNRYSLLNPIKNALPDASSNVGSRGNSYDLLVMVVKKFVPDQVGRLQRQVVTIPATLEAAISLAARSTNNENDNAIYAFVEINPLRFHELYQGSSLLNELVTHGNVGLLDEIIDIKNIRFDLGIKVDGKGRSMEAALDFAFKSGKLEGSLHDEMARYLNFLREWNQHYETLKQYNKPDDFHAVLPWLIQNSRACYRKLPSRLWSIAMQVVYIGEVPFLETLLSTCPYVPREGEPSNPFLIEHAGATMATAAAEEFHDEIFPQMYEFVKSRSRKECDNLPATALPGNELKITADNPPLNQPARVPAGSPSAQPTIKSLTKPCPNCATAIAHYRSHGGSHETVCPNCNHRICYLCLNDYGTGTGQGCSKCPKNCDSTCDCPTCPDCKRNKPCSKCKIVGCLACAGKDGGQTPQK